MKMTLNIINVQDFRGQKFTIHDDAIDSLEMAINNIDQIKIKRRATMTVIPLASAYQKGGY